MTVGRAALRVCSLVSTALLLTSCSDSRPGGSAGSGPASSADSASAVSGLLLLDGAINGCEGESVLVQVRNGPGDVASESVPSATEGFDCVYRFYLPVPRLDCYELVIDKQPVGGYPADEGGGVELGVISAESVYGDPASEADPPLYADFDDGPCA